MAPNSSAEVSAPAAQQPIPTYRIDLSLPPSERYTKLALDFAPRMQEITPLFDEVLATVIPWAWLRRVIEWLASLVLFRVCSAEETQELKGISKSSGVPLYFIITLNLLLDSLLGCTSGSVLTRPERRRETEENPWDEEEGTERMMHFRTLDWGMDALRSVLVIIEFVRSESESPEKVIASSITYAGFVGILTGVREKLSLSLNFRPNHNCSTLSLRIHQLAVLLGFRPSTTSILRSTFLPPAHTPTGSLEDLTNTLATSRTAPCYLILSSGAKSTVIEKDLLDGKTRSSSDFIVQTNHDVRTTDPSGHTHSQSEKSTVIGMESLVEESKERQECVVKKWNSLVRRQEKKRREIGEGNEGETGRTVVRERTLLGWIKAYPVMNECTHFGCLLDPKSGTIQWLERGEEEEDSAED